MHKIIFEEISQEKERNRDKVEWTHSCKRDKRLFNIVAACIDFEY